MESLFEDCQTWIERGHESWNSYFSKWENYAKYEENLTEGELNYELNRKEKSKSRVRKKVKQPLSEKRLKILPCKSLKNRNLVKKGKKIKKTKKCTRDKKVQLCSKDENLETVSEIKQLEISLKTVFSSFLKANRNKYQMFDVLFQTYSHSGPAVNEADNLIPKQKRLPSNDFQLNMTTYSFENKQTLLSPLTLSSLNIRTICPNRNTYIQSLYKNVEGIHFKATERDLRQRGYEDVKDFQECSFNTQIHQKFLAHGSQTPPSVPRMNLEVKSCPPLYQHKWRVENEVPKSFHLDFNRRFPSSFYQKTNKEYFKNTTISKMNLTQERKRLGNLCLHKRTNSVSLSMENSNFITPERNSSEQKHFNKIVSQRRHLSKKLFFSNEEDDSESDDQAEYHSPLIRCQNKRLKADEPIIMDSDSDDCESILDRVVKS